MSPTRRARRFDLPGWIGPLIFATALAGYVTTAGGSLATTDAVAAFDLTRQIVDHHSLALSGDVLGNPAYRGVDGRYYSPFGLAQSIWNVPFYVGGRVAAGLISPAPAGTDMIAKAVVALGNTVPAALCVYVTWLFALRWVRMRTPALALACAVGFATSLWPYSKFGFNVPLAALLLLAAHYAAWRAGHEASPLQAWLSGTWLGLALLTRHELAIAGVFIGLWMAWTPAGNRGRILVAWMSGVLPGAVIWALYNFVRFGSPVDGGYMRDQVLAWGSSTWAGVYGLWLSPAASVIIYSPVAALGVWALLRAHSAHRRFAWLLLGEVATFTLFYAQLENWVGGRSYGPRFLVPLLPLMCLPLAEWFTDASRVRRQIATSIAVLSMAVQVPGVVVDFAKARVAYAQQTGTTGRQMAAGWRAAPIVLNTKAAMIAVPAAIADVTGRRTPRLVERSGPDDRTFSQQFANTLDFWWMALFYMNVWSARAAVGMGATLLLCFALLCATAWTRARRLDAGGAPPSSVP